MRSWLTVSAVLVATFVVVVVGAHLAVGSVADRVFRDIDALPSHAVAIVPGAGLRPDGSPHDILSERLRCAERLFESGRVTHILVSGDGGSHDHDEANAMRRWLVARGVPEASVQMDYAGFRTRDTMERAARIFGVRDAVICTQGLHANRSVYLALDAGIDADVLVARGDDWFTFGARLRERAATVVAVFDALVGTEPRFLGPRIPIGSVALTPR